MMLDITAFLTAIPKTRLQITDHKQITIQLANNFALADGVLENIDLLVRTQKVAQPTFYNGYHGIRPLVGDTYDKNAVIGKATDAATGEPLKNVMFKFNIDVEASKLKPSDSYPEIVKLTQARGGFYIKSIQEGEYKVTITKLGYIDQTLTLTINKGELKRIEVQMVKK